MSRQLGIGIGLACVAAIAFVLWPDPAPEGPEGGRADAPQREEAPAAPAEPKPLAPGADHAIESGQTLDLDSAALPDDRPLVLQLELGEPSRDLEPRPVRIIGPDGRLFHTHGPVDESDRLSARIEVDSEWLTPGRYIVEVKTTERTHFPLRRYALEIR
ncbi:MAG: hypothetical protein QNK04_28830 [Myxococcota bacterium]|nr:hypothetical protein [Myxococcota bacterium]